MIKPVVYAANKKVADKIKSISGDEYQIIIQSDMHYCGYEKPELKSSYFSERAYKPEPWKSKGKQKMPKVK